MRYNIKPTLINTTFRHNQLAKLAQKYSMLQKIKVHLELFFSHDVLYYISVTDYQKQVLTLNVHSASIYNRIRFQHTELLSFLRKSLPALSSIDYKLFPKPSTLEFTQQKQVIENSSISKNQHLSKKTIEVLRLLQHNTNCSPRLSDAIKKLVSVDHFVEMDDDYKEREE